DGQRADAAGDLDQAAVTPADLVDGVGTDGGPGADVVGRAWGRRILQELARRVGGGRAERSCLLHRQLRVTGCLGGDVLSVEVEELPLGLLAEELLRRPEAWHQDRVVPARVRYRWTRPGRDDEGHEHRTRDEQRAESAQTTFPHDFPPRGERTTR